MRASEFRGVDRSVRGGYITRVELHLEKDDEDPFKVYETLDTAMEGAGFTRVIKGKLGGTCKLPNAEYNYEKEGEINEVLEKATRVATIVAKDMTERPFEILVSKATDCTWIGLERL